MKKNATTKTKTLAMIHTVSWFNMSVVEPFAAPWARKNPGIQLVNIADDSLLAESLTAGKMTTNVARRIVQYALCAENAGADAVMVTCTTVNGAAALARQVLRVPCFNIDEPMAKQAVALGDRIGIVATVPTSAPATRRLLCEAAEAMGKRIQIETVIHEKAFTALMKGDRATHDKLVHREIDKLAGKVDVIALGQISLAQIKYDCGKPILQVGQSGFAEAKRLLLGK